MFWNLFKQQTTARWDEARHRVDWSYSNVNEMQFILMFYLHFFRQPHIRARSIRHTIEAAPKIIWRMGQASRARLMKTLERAGVSQSNERKMERNLNLFNTTEESASFWDLRQSDGWCCWLEFNSYIYAGEVKMEKKKKRNGRECTKQSLFGFLRLLSLFFDAARSSEKPPSSSYTSSRGMRASESPRDDKCRTWRKLLFWTFRWNFFSIKIYIKMFDTYEMDVFDGRFFLFSLLSSLSHSPSPCLWYLIEN